MSTWEEIAPGLWRASYVTPTDIAATTLALRLADGGIAVVSPCSRPDDAFFAATEALGKVAALVAPNSGHDLGQQAWQDRYPDAACYAPAVAVPALKKSKPKLRAFEPLAELAPRLPPNVRVTDVPGSSAGLTLLSVEAGERSAMTVDETIGNSPKLIGPAIFRFAFWLTGSGPGLARSKLWWMIFAKDKKAVARALLAEYDRVKPSVLLPLHGDPIRGEGVARSREMLAPLA